MYIYEYLRIKILHSHKVKCIARNTYAEYCIDKTEKIGGLSAHEKEKELSSINARNREAIAGKRLEETFV